MADLHSARHYSEIYDSKERFENLARKFSERFGSPPDFYVRAPGRVNLIGEHIDYCGFPVLPISIQQDVVIAGRTLNETRDITITNVDDSFPEFSCNIRKIEISEVQWYSYVLAGYLGIAKRINTLPPGLQVMVDGSVPMSAGLSSSSALVCASALLATLVLKDKSLSREQIAELCAKSERYVGTEGGGMDQAISFLGVKGKAQLINFNPVRCEPVTLPDSVTFVVSNCLVNKWKADGTDFNNRVAECRLGCKVLGCKLGSDWRSIATYHHLMTSREMKPEQLHQNALQHLHSHPYSKQEIMEILGCSEEEFSTIIGRSNNEQFKLFDRADHVAGEAARVAQFHKLCADGNPNAEELGALIDASHLSLKDKYNVSIDELDTLTQICREAGALGSRLVGAGFGGCTISMLPKSMERKFIQEVYEKYYAPRNLKFEECHGRHIFPTSPGHGACLLEGL